MTPEVTTDMVVNLLSPELAAGISRGRGVKQLGFRFGNWLTTEQSSQVLKHACGDTMRAKRDYAMFTENRAGS
jgi:hypothetical protein